MACRNILSLLRVPASVHTLFPLLLALREVEPVASWLREARSKGSSRKSSQSSSAYITRPAKVTQGPWKQELPEGGPHLGQRTRVRRRSP